MLSDAQRIEEEIWAGVFELLMGFDEDLGEILDYSYQKSKEIVEEEVSGMKYWSMRGFSKFF